ncbi:MAG: GNAT family N-acetyltransferase [Lachnospiraceae bacterium]|nr:GNAT family N-acetyltransferase [Lachnospiraceae bacterium]MDE6982057.1 GNAT family N-acetyltransferase [Lachnospiraceae bacterium]
MERENGNLYKIALLGWEEIEKLYHTNMQQDFPAPEIKPFGMIEDLHQRGLNKAYGLFGKGERELCAYAMFEAANEGNVWLLDYFAVDEGKRSLGLGSVFLSQLADVLKETTDTEAVFLEIERIEKAADERQRLIREQRKRFYLKNGVVETNIFTVADGGMDYEILCLPVQKQIVGQAAGEKIQKIYETFFKEGDYEIQRCHHSNPFFTL